MTNKEKLQNIEDSLSEYGAASFSGDTIIYLLSRIKTLTAACEEAEGIMEIFTMEIEVGNKRVWANTANEWIRTHGKALEES